MVRFGDVVKNVNSVERGPEAAGIERIVGLDHLDPGNLHIRRWDTPGKGTSFTRKFTPGQTLFGKRRAYQRKVAYAEFEGICSGDILTFEPKDKNTLLPELLSFICQTNAFFEHALGTSAGSLSPRTNWGALSEFEFALPPIEEQKCIAEILWATDEVEKQYHEAIGGLRETALAVQNECFGSYLKRGKQGLIPVVKLGSVLEQPIVNGIFRTRDQYGRGTLLVNVTDIYGSFRVGPNTLERVETDARERTTFSAIPGDVIFNRSSLVFDGIGKACLVPEWDEPVVFECHLMRARPDARRIDPRYLCRYSLSPFGRRYLFSRAQTTTMTTINQGDLGEMPIPLPTLDQQASAADRLDSVDASIEDMETHVQRAVMLRNDLINGLLAGGNAHV